MATTSTIFNGMFGTAEASIIVALIALLGVIVQGIFSNRKQFNDLMNQVNNLVTTMKLLTGKMEQLIQHNNEMDKLVTVMQKELTAVWKRIDEHTAKIEKLQDEERR